MEISEDDFNRAVTSQRDIGIAVGIVMSQSRLTQQQAFDSLVRASQRTNVPVRDIAARIVADRDAAARRAHERERDLAEPDGSPAAAGPGARRSRDHRLDHEVRGGCLADARGSGRPPKRSFADAQTDDAPRRPS
jgi:hypothetical protein